MTLVSKNPQNQFIQSQYWNNLGQEDRVEFQRLRQHFHQNQKITTKDPRLICFSNELSAILKFIEHSAQGRENRTILAGVAFAGPFICVNTRQLKNFLGRCKSSINGSFQQLGYVALKTKSKARTCVLSLLPSLMNDQNTLRQWTVRWASNDAKFCFVTSLTNIQLPNITEDDLNDDHKSSVTQRMNINPVSQLLAMPRTYSVPIKAPVEPIEQINYAQNDMINSPFSYGFNPEMTSYSVSSFQALDIMNDDNHGDDWNPMLEHRSLPRSQSVNFGKNEQIHYDFDYFDSFA